MFSLSVQGKLLMLLFHLRMWSFSEDESLETWKFNQSLIWEIAISMLSKGTWGGKTEGMHLDEILW